MCGTQPVRRSLVVWEMVTTSKVMILLLRISAWSFLESVFLGGTFPSSCNISTVSPQLSVPSSCLMSLHESLTRTYPTGTVTWFVSVRTFPLSSAATRWTLKTEKWRPKALCFTARRTCRYDQVELRGSICNVYYCQNYFYLDDHFDISGLTVIFFEQCIGF